MLHFDKDKILLELSQTNLAELEETDNLFAEDANKEAYYLKFKFPFKYLKEINLDKRQGQEVCMKPD